EPCSPTGHWIVQVSAVYHDRGFHQFAEPCNVEGAVLLPFSEEDESLGSAGGLVGGLAVGEAAVVLREQLPYVVEGLRVVQLKPRPIAQQSLDDLQTRRSADVICSGLKGKPEDADRLILQHPQRSK